MFGDSILEFVADGIASLQCSTSSDTVYYVKADVPIPSCVPNTPNACEWHGGSLGSAVQMLTIQEEVWHQHQYCNIRTVANR